MLIENYFKSREELNECLKELKAIENKAKEDLRYEEKRKNAYNLEELLCKSLSKFIKQEYFVKEFYDDDEAEKFYENYSDAYSLEDLTEEDNSGWSSNYTRGYLQVEDGFIRIILEHIYSDIYGSYGVENVEVYEIPKEFIK